MTTFTYTPTDAPLTAGQAVAYELTGFGHQRLAEYVGPVKVSKRHPDGGHYVIPAGVGGVKGTSKVAVRACFATTGERTVR